MKKTIYGLTGLLVAMSGVLLSFAPDTLSFIVVTVMCGVIVMGIALNFYPSLGFITGFEHGLRSIFESLEVQTVNNWVGITKIDKLFQQRTMDQIFHDYKAKVEAQMEKNEIVSDLEEYLNEDTMALWVWQGLAGQIPGILTGLGILGTFLGLIIGINGVGFSSVEAALESVQILLQGIEAAFYTSIAGVILSILFNIEYRFIWNVLLRQGGMFLDAYHKQVMPSVEEQLRQKSQKDNQKIIELLERLPKNPGYSMSSSFSGLQDNSVHSQVHEQIMMPQIIAGLKNHEFTFYLQPRVNLANRDVVSAEALARWNHEKLGLLSPSNFIPIVEKNGYITRLDQYMWEEVCITLRRWIDEGMRPLPISINISKTDVLAMDLPAFFAEMLNRYRIPPRLLEMEIARNSYIQNGDATREAEAQLRRMGFKVVVDGFDGDFVALHTMEEIEADCLKLDLRFMEDIAYNKLFNIYSKAKMLGIELYAEGIEHAEQVSQLKKAGFLEGQGYYFYNPLSIDEYELILNKKL